MRRTVVGLLAAVAVALGVAAPSPAIAAGLPSRPALAATNTVAGTFLTWTASGAVSFKIQQATDSAFTRDVRTYWDRDGRDRQFTPPNVVQGRTYWYRILGAGTAGYGAWSAPLRVSVAARSQAVRVMTYNVLTNGADGSIVGAETVAPWSQRVLGVRDLILRGDPDLVAIQEGSGWVGAVKGPKQVDDLVARLGGAYALASTETPVGMPGWYRTGRYILYKPTVYEPVGAGGHWVLREGRYAAYQVFRHKATGAKLLFVSLHLSVDGGSTGDAYRETEMGRLITSASRLAAAGGNLPVVYAGDTNSHDGSNHVFDGPGNATRAARIADAFKSTYWRGLPQVNSANQYLRQVPMSGRSLDRVFGTPGVGLRGWALLANLSGNRLVGLIPSDHNPVQVDLTIPY